MKAVRDISILVFIFTVLILTAIALLTIWGFVGEDVYQKSILTGIIVTIASIISSIASSAMRNEDTRDETENNINVNSNSQQNNINENNG